MENIDLKIEQYLNDDLSPDDLVEFRQRLKTDSALELEVKKEKMIRAAIDAHEKERFKAQLSALKKKEPIPLKSNRIKWLSIAAAIALFLIPSFQFFQHSSSNIANHHYVADQSITSQLLSPDQAQTPMDLAIAAYKKENFGEAIERLTAINNNAQATYVLGHTYYSAENYEQAIDQFKKVIASQNPEYLEKANWYLLLSMLKVDKIDDEFSTLMDQIINQGGSYSDSAKAIKDKLDSFWRI